MTWHVPIDRALVPTMNRDLFVGAHQTHLPIPPHPGAFGIKRKHHTHEGVDLYCPQGTPVYTVEPGVVVAVIPFTGRLAMPPSPWWRETDAVLVEGASGVVVYGEIQSRVGITVGERFQRGDLVGYVVQVLTKDKGYCIDPSVLVLKSDLTWRYASDIRVGDELIGVDESLPGHRKQRRLRLTTVERTTEFVSPRVRVHTDRGSIVVSRNHPFLATRAPNLRTQGTYWGAYYWVHAENLKPGCRIAYLTEPWREETSWEAGWLAGMYDGEGSLPNTGRGNWISVYQKPGGVEQQLRQALSRRGLLDGERFDQKSGVQELKTYSIDHVMRLIGSVRPLRMLSTFKEQITRGRHPAKGKSPATVVCIEPIDNGTVIGIQTSTRTLITDGFVSHNSTSMLHLELHVLGTRNAYDWIDERPPSLLDPTPFLFEAAREGEA